MTLGGYGSSFDTPVFEDDRQEEAPDAEVAAVVLPNPNGVAGGGVANGLSRPPPPPPQSRPTSRSGSIAAVRTNAVNNNNKSYGGRSNGSSAVLRSNGSMSSIANGRSNFRYHAGTPSLMRSNGSLSSDVKAAAAAAGETFSGVRSRYSLASSMARVGKEGDGMSSQEGFVSKLSLASSPGDGGGGGGDARKVEVFALQTKAKEVECTRV